MSTLLMQEVEEPPAWEQVQALAHHQAPARVDQVVARLFPIPTVGQLFYTRFRERASREQTTLPDEPADTVVICTKSIATLAQELGIGFDTTQKYVALYKALGLLKKRKVMGKLAFIMGAGIYHPPECLEANLQHLLKIIKGRHKFRELVSDVLARCRVYGLITQDFQAAAALLQDLLQPQQGETRRTLEQRLLQAGQVFNQVLSSMHLPKTGGQEDAQWFHFSGIVEAEESPQAKTSGRHNESDRKLPRPAHRVDSSALHQSPQAAQSGGFGQEDPAQNLPHLLHRIDSASSRPEDEATHTHAQGRFEGEAPVRNLPDPPHQIDSARPQTVDEATHTHVQSRFEGETPVSRPPTSAHRVDSSATSPIKRTVESTQPDQRDRFGQEAAASNPPNPTAQVDSSAPTNVNVDVITIINMITLNVKHVAAFCCNALGEPLSKQPIYLKVFRECERDAQAISAALLFTLVHRRDGTMHNPASVFITRCRDYHAQGVPEEAAALVKQYGSLSYPQLLAALRKPVAFTPPVRGAPPPAGRFSPPATPSSLSPLPRWGTIPRCIQVEHDRPGMSREAALQVIRRAQGDRRTKMCRVDLERLADGSYAVLLDNTITAVPRQTYFYSIQDWETRTAAITDCFELFGVARSGRRCLADALKARRAVQ